MHRKLLISSACALLFLQTATLFAQNAGEPRTIQPSIMVIPFARENQDMRKVLESDINLRVAVTKVKEGFDKRGFSTVDFVAKIQNGQQ
jgi:hypothetical protein